MLKATSINKFGCESTPVSVEVNAHGYVELPFDPDAIQYALYAPFFDESETGPWYLLRAISRREAKTARQTVVGTYRQRDLLPKLCPETAMKIALPEADYGQLGWFIHGGTNPKAPALMWIEVNPRPQIGV